VPKKWTVCKLVQGGGFMGQDRLLLFQQPKEGGGTPDDEMVVTEPALK